MQQRLTSWHPDAALGLAIYGFAAVLFPLHLGWTGASWGNFAAYAALATALFFTADALTRPRINRLSTVPQLLLTFVSIGAPGALAFAAGSFAGPIDEAFDDQVCLAKGATEDDTFEAESDDTFDLTPDCNAKG